MTKMLNRVSDPAGLARMHVRAGFSLVRLASSFKNDVEGWKIARRAYRAAKAAG